MGQLLISLGQCGPLSVTSFTEGHGVLVCVGLVFLFFEGYHTNLVFFSLSLKLTLKPANNTSNSSLERSCDACGFVFSLSFVKLQ